MNGQVNSTFELIAKQLNSVTDFELLLYLMQHFPSDWKNDLLKKTKKFVIFKLEQAKNVHTEKIRIAVSMMKFHMLPDEILGYIFQYLTPRQLLGSKFHIINKRFHKLILKRSNSNILFAFRLNAAVYRNVRNRASWIDDYTFNFDPNCHWLRIPRIVYDHFFNRIFPTNYSFWKIMIHRLSWSTDQVFGDENDRIRLTRDIFSKVPKERWPDMFQYDINLSYDYCDPRHDAGRKHRIKMYSDILSESKYSKQGINLKFLMKDSEFGAVCNSIKRNWFQLTKILIEEYGAPVYEYPIQFDNSDYLFFQTTPLYEAIQHRTVSGMKMVSYLLEKGADSTVPAHCLIPQSTEFGQMCNQHTETYDILHELFRKTACIPRFNTKNNESKEIEYTLLRVKNIWTISQKRKTVSSYQILFDNLEHGCSPTNDDIKALIEHCLNIQDVRTENGGTILHYLAQKWSNLHLNLQSHRQIHTKFISLIPLFIQYGVNFHTLDNHDMTAAQHLQYSSEHQQLYYQIYELFQVI